jgi:hypothetical protein
LLQGLAVVDEGGVAFLNVDTTTEVGLAKAKPFRVAESGLADIVYSSYFSLAAESIFSSGYEASAFILIRDPIERAISIWENSDLKNMGMTLEEFVSRGHVERNALTRLIVQKHGVDLNQEDAFRAMEILRRKTLIGLSSRIDESLERFRHFHQWGDWMQNSCYAKIRSLEDELENTVTVERGGPAWSLIMEQNHADEKLYEYAVDLFDEQANLVSP